MQLTKVAVGVAALATVASVAACSSSKNNSSSNSSANGGSSPSAGAGGSSGASGGACGKYSAYTGHKGTTVTMFGSILSPESDSLNKSWAKFSQCTGITIKYTGSNSFESDLPVKVNGGNAPDLAIIPQPGLLQQMVATGAVKAPPEQTVKNEDAWAPAWKSYGSVGGKFYAAPMSANMKSLVWYSPSYFKQHNYTVPTTWADLMSLSAKMASDNTAGGFKPWCGGIGSGTASGWPATDWLEEVVLGKYGGDVYDTCIGPVLFAGRIRPEKRLDLVIESAMRWPPHRRLAVLGGWSLAH